MIQLHNKKFEAFIQAKELDFAIQNMAKQIAADFSKEIPVFIGVLNGSFMVMADLMKYYEYPCEVSFVKLASYEGMQSTNNVKQLIGLNESLEGRSVIVVEDIVDTGNTVEELKQIFKEQKVKHFKIATLFFKPEAYTKDIKLDYIGIRIPNKFIVGYTGTMGMANALEYLIEASILMVNNDEVHFVLVGDGYLKESLIKKTFGNSNITFIDKINKSKYQISKVKLSKMFIFYTFDYFRV